MRLDCLAIAGLVAMAIGAAYCPPSAVLTGGVGFLALAWYLALQEDRRRDS